MPDRHFPPLDHLHSQQLVDAAGRVRQWQVHPGCQSGSIFWTEINIESTVLYPTRGLAHGKMVDYEWAAAACRAYNDWLHDAYLKVDPRFWRHGVDPDAGATARQRRSWSVR